MSAPNSKAKICEYQPNRYYYPQRLEASLVSPTNSSCSFNGLQVRSHPESRKSVRFSDQIGCRRIPCLDTHKSIMERISCKLKSLVFNIEPSKHTSGVLCLPKIDCKRRSASCIETAVWNSGRQLRQVPQSPTFFKRISDFTFDKWRSQRSPKSLVFKQRIQLDLDMDSHFGKMESVYMFDVDNDYEWGSTPSEWEGYENSQSILRQRLKLERGNSYESNNQGSLDEDYEFDEYVTPKGDRSDILASFKCTQCKVVDESLPRTESPDKKASTTTATAKMTELQDRVAKSLCRLNLPEWMQQKKGEGTSKAFSRFPRFPRYIHDDLIMSELTLPSPPLLRIHK